MTDLGRFGLRNKPRRLDDKVLFGMAKAGGAAMTALAYDEYVANPIVQKTDLARRLTAPRDSDQLPGGLGAHRGRGCSQPNRGR